jgi:hypothetical protein
VIEPLGLLLLPVNDAAAAADLPEEATLEVVFEVVLGFVVEDAALVKVVAVVVPEIGLFAPCA